METSLRYLACVGLAVISLGGCATNHYKPMGLSALEAENKLNSVLYQCHDLHQGDYINITFYPDAATAGKNTQGYTGTRTGYFYACNKMNATLSISNKHITLLDRGEVIPLMYIESVIAVDDPAPQAAFLEEVVDKIVQKVFEVGHDDPERALLTQ